MFNRLHSGYENIQKHLFGDLYIYYMENVRRKKLTWQGGGNWFSREPEGVRGANRFHATK